MGGGADFETTVKLSVYRHIADSAKVPTAEELAKEMRQPREAIGAAFRRLQERRVLVLEGDQKTIRMAPPFSGVPTQHVARVAGRSFFANCAWDALGIPACLHLPGEVHSRCDQSMDPIHLRVGSGGPDPEPCVIHFAVPAALWWRDIVFT
jgi:hypothetical protein